MKILLDNGHGSNTPGKRSFDGKLLEYAYCREIVTGIYSKLKAEGYDVEIITPENIDISLTTRVKRVNNICAKVGANNCLLISVHNNAAAGSTWSSAAGWTVWIAKTASSNSKKLAQILYSQAEKRKLKGNRYVPECKYWTADYTIVKKTNCPAVLTENLFMTNKSEVEYLLSNKGKQAIIDLHVDGIKEYIATTK